MKKFNVFFISRKALLRERLSIKVSLFLMAVTLCFIHSKVNAQWNPSGTNVYTNGNVGIGTSTPWVPLAVKGTVQSFDATAGFVFSNRNPTSSPIYIDPILPPLYITNNTSWTWYAQDQVARLYIHDEYGTGSYFSRDVLAITADGKLGVGTTAPQQALHVVGTMRATQNILAQGIVGIGTLTPDPAYKLSVNGSIRAKEIRVNTGWADFVFENDYPLLPLTEVEKFIQHNKHLPEIPSAEEVEKNGIELGDMQSKLLQKIEELTLYIIELNKRIETLENK